jgi:hypothetical protein
LLVSVPLTAATGRRVPKRCQITALQISSHFVTLFMTSVKQKTCSSCGNDFGCGAEGDQGSCWCVDLPHLPLSSISSGDCFCPSCLNDVIGATQIRRTPEQSGRNSPRSSQQVLSAKETQVTSPVVLIEGEDYYLEAGLIVFTARYHLRRGYCCDSGCRHCPYNDV